MIEPLSAGVFASVGPIDLKIRGNTSALYELSTAISRVARKLGGVEDQLGKLSRNVGYFWEGESFDSFEHATSQHATAIDELAGIAKEAASVIEAYSGLIERGRNHFADYADAATKAELVVVPGESIHPPPTPDMRCYVDGSDREATETYTYQVELFTEIRSLVEQWRADAEEWIITYFAPLVAKCTAESGVDKLVTVLQESELEVVNAAIEAAEGRTNDALGQFLDTQRGFEDSWSEHKGDGRSGDPSRRQRAELFDEDAHRQARQDLDGKIAKLKPADFLLKGGKALGPLGTVAQAAFDLSQGESPSTVGAGVVGGAGGGALGGALATIASSATAGFIGGPPGTIVGGGVGLILVAGGAIAGSVGGEFGWEAWVPLRTRQAIDEGLSREYKISPHLDPYRREYVANYESY